MPVFRFSAKKVEAPDFGSEQSSHASINAGEVHAQILLLTFQ
jgi:hypothetical protein